MAWPSSRIPAPQNAPRTEGGTSSRPGIRSTSRASVGSGSSQVKNSRGRRRAPTLQRDAVSVRTGNFTLGVSAEADDGSMKGK